MLDEEALLADPDDEEALFVDVQVCEHCFHLVYPDGCDEEYVNPDVLWPCSLESH
jgi:hypothetical protein